MVMRHVFVLLLMASSLVLFTIVNLGLIRSLFHNVHMRKLLATKVKKENIFDNTSQNKTSIIKTLYPVTVSGPYKIENKDACRHSGRISCLVIVHTAPSHSWRRNEMRRTWLNRVHYSPENIVVIFLLGTTDDATQEAIHNESLAHGDIVQGYFVDSYQNLTHKGVMGYRWITENCRKAEIVIKIDDDAFINFFKFFEEFKYVKQKEKFIFCNAINANSMLIIRDKFNKWYVPKDQFKDRNTYPHPYCSGFVVFLSTDLIPSLYRAAVETPFFWVDDVYLFGILPSKVNNITRETFGKHLSFHHPKALKCYKEKQRNCELLVMPARDKEIDIMWKAVTSDRKQSNYGNYYLA